MIVMINGSFGVGKTTVAGTLHRELPGSLIYDPELVGSMLAEICAPVRLPHEVTDDFQDLDLWPVLVVETAAALHRQYGCHLIVPMTIDDPARFAGIRAGLGAIDSKVHHFCLRAPLERIEERIRSRSEGNGEWVFRRARECVSRLQGPAFETYLDAETRSPSDLAREILDRARSGT